MTRPPKTIDVQRARRDNYVAHFDNRKYVAALPPELQMCYLEASRAIITPKLNPYGADSYSDEEWTLIINLAQQRGLQAFYVNPWYASDEGWAEFQRQWQELPEEVTGYVVNTDWILQRAHV